MSCRSPPKLADLVGALVHERFPVGHKESEIALDPCEGRDRLLGVSQGDASDRLRIDRVGLATDPVGPPSLAHHPRRHPHQFFTAGDQVTLEVPGHVTAVLDSEAALHIETASPFQESLEPRGAGLHRELPDHLTRHAVDRDGGVGLFVRIDPHYDHLWSPPSDAHTGWQDHRRTRLSGAHSR
jgi:hypothetical protein